MKPQFISRLEQKWGVTTRQVVLILLVFAFTGSTVVAIKQPLFALLNVQQTEPLWLRSVLYLIFVFPLYQLLLLGYGFLFGQFSFFWEKEKRMVRFLARPFRKS